MDSDLSRSARFYAFLAWIEANKRKLLILLVAVLVLALIFSIWSWRKDVTEASANRDLIAITETGASGRHTTPQEYLAVAQRYPGTHASERAELLAAAALYLDGKSVESQRQFVKFIEEHGDSPLAPQAAMGAAASLEAQGKLKESAAKYREIITQYPQDTVVPQAKLTLARIHETLNEPEQALKIYEGLSRVNARDVWAAEANERRERLLSRNPNLAKSVVPFASTNASPPLRKTTP